ncbi:hypothetical protein GXY_02913 [Novacetimonas hansenii ATCC 23769]|uniref:Uncharacterized protein n=1 Tax=Novacetimonas hansenii ATCC 23769 TaxID=714995 RepID=D5QBT6_NOVHA|nr:hypothetical protein GXY_02913 [Novacetimonas hansenii ATCC 23769]
MHLNLTEPGFQWILVGQVVKNGVERVLMLAPDVTPFHDQASFGRDIPRKAPPEGERVRGVTSFPVPAARPANEGAVVLFLISEQVETAMAKEGSSSAQSAGPPSLERRVHRMRPEPFAAGTR